MQCNCDQALDLIKQRDNIKKRYLTLLDDIMEYGISESTGKGVHVRARIKAFRKDIQQTIPCSRHELTKWLLDNGHDRELDMVNIYSRGAAIHISFEDCVCAVVPQLYQKFLLENVRAA